MAFAIHLVHVLSMAILVGGSTAGALVGGSRRLEVVLWGAAGAVVVTGVGNVGGYGEALPGPSTRWGAVLLAKLVLVALLLAASVRRSLLVRGGAAAAGWYHATAGIGVVVAALGVWLAHG